MTPAVSDLRSQVTTIVRELIASIKEVDVALIANDAPLFRTADGDTPAVELDSLDALDLSLELKDRFDPDGDVLEALFRDNPDPTVFATVNEIVAFLLSTLPAIGGEHSARGPDQPSFQLQGGNSK